MYCVIDLLCKGENIKGKTFDIFHLNKIIIFYYIFMAPANSRQERRHTDSANVEPSVKKTH